MDNYSNTSELAKLQFNKKIEEYQEKNITLSERDEAALFAQCVELQVLKAPASAVFPSFDEMVVNGSDGHYSVSGFVDSQNSYGATIRSSFTYNIEKTEGQWKCTDTFVDSASQISSQLNSNMVSNSILWWILSIAGTIITYFIISASLDF
ncbi:MAG: hypothetical protein IJ306_05025 [Oscillospiraceae bacterium]|nr:hypothetical protein [Oscillospiraceae bacterium]